MISFNVKKTAGLDQFLSELPRGVKAKAVRAASEYFIGDANHGLKKEPTRVEHGEENPYIWNSEKQRRAFFATNGFGRGIPTVRTHQLSESWTMKETNYQYDRIKIINNIPYAIYVMGKAQQLGHKADKWRLYQKVIADNLKGAIQKAQQAVGAYLASRR